MNQPRGLRNVLGRKIKLSKQNVDIGINVECRRSARDGVLLMPEEGGCMEKKKQTETVQIGNTTFSVISIFSGTVQLQHLIKRLIQKEIEQKNYVR